MGEFQTMLRKIVLVCLAAVTAASFAIPTEALAAKKRVVHVEGKPTTFFRGQGWIFTGKDWTGVGMYPFGAWTDNGCWRHDRERPRWRGVWVCKPY